MEFEACKVLQEAEISMEVLKIRELVRKANQCGMSITDYTIRRAIKQGKLPCRKLDRTYLIPWKLFVRWILCEDDLTMRFPEKQKTKCSDFCTLVSNGHLRYHNCRII